MFLRSGSTFENIKESNILNAMDNVQKKNATRKEQKKDKIEFEKRIVEPK